MQNHSTNTKLSYSVEIIPICKDDVVCLPAKVARAMSNISQITVCHRVGNQIYLIDPLTLTLGDISSNVYWRAPFNPLANIPQATEFIVLDIEPTCHPPKTAKGGRFLLADAQVAPVGGSMNSDTIFHTRTHLGAVLKPGDTVLGYMLASSNYNNDDFAALNQDRIPEVVLVRKTYPNRLLQGMQPLPGPAYAVGNLRPRVARAARYLPSQAKGSIKSSPNRRWIHLDGASLEEVEGQVDDPEGGK